nr:RNA-directed DNA polymerase, eukaryota, reverse transcriptase zinc-binding domain protein [Tanacetum cinerariifolium]
LLNFERLKNVSVAHKLLDASISTFFCRCPRGGIEESQLHNISQLLSSVVLSSSSDRLSWTLNGNGKFSVKSAREEIDKNLLITSPSPTRWYKLLPIKLNVFMWRMLLDKLPTIINLSSRSLDIPSDLCPNCDGEVETRNHLFFGCPMAHDLSRLLARWWNIHIPILLDPSESWLKESDDLTKLEDMDTVQKARIVWVVEGDENSKFFHGILKQKRRLGCGSQKAYGPDGFYFLFLKLYWEILKSDVEASVGNFYYSFVMPKDLSQPIEKKVVDKVVSPEKSAFISGWQILDGYIMLSQIMVWHTKRNQKIIMFKVDFKKAHDTSFGSSVLVNGSPTSVFPIKCGLRQGDPLSPFLFIIGIEAIHVTLQKTINLGLIRGIKVGDSGLNISHFFYADNVVITSKCDSQVMDNIIRVLHVFNLTSGVVVAIKRRWHGLNSTISWLPMKMVDNWIDNGSLSS